MIRSIGGADYSYQYRLQPIVLINIIGPITCTADVSVPLTLHSLHRFIERFFKRDYSEALPTQHWAFAPFAECPEVAVGRSGHAWQVASN